MSGACLGELKRVTATTDSVLCDKCNTNQDSMKLNPNIPFSTCGGRFLSLLRLASTLPLGCHQLNVGASRSFSNACYETLYKPDDWSLDKDIHLLFQVR